MTGLPVVIDLCAANDGHSIIDDDNTRCDLYLFVPKPVAYISVFSEAAYADMLRQASSARKLLHYPVEEIVHPSVYAVLRHSHRCQKYR